MVSIKELPKVEGLIKDGDRVSHVVLAFDNYKKFIRKLSIEGAIDEADYLRRYPDVAAAVKDGKVASALEHYLKTGYVEQRKAAITSAPDKAAAKPAVVPAIAANTAKRLVR